MPDGHENTLEAAVPVHITDTTSASNTGDCPPGTPDPAIQ